MKNKILYPFAFTALFAALSGCGGESANVIPEQNDEATTNGSCSATATNCLEWGLEYPIDGLNFNCSGDKENTFITLFDQNDGVASGTCQKADSIEFYLKSFSDTKIKLGTVKLSEYMNLSTSSQLPRLSVLDIAKGITGRNIARIEQTDPTVQVAMKLVKIWQTLALEKGRIYNPTDVQPLYITEDMRKNLGKINKDINLTDANLAETLKPFIDISQISDDQAFEVVKKLANIASAAVYQPEFSLFSTSGIISSNLTGSDGLAGCNKSVCDIKDKTTKYLFGHFILITDRQGYTFGSGLQWRDTQLKLGSNNLGSLGGINAELIRKVKPQQITAVPQTSWISPATRMLSSNAPYKMNVANNSNPLEIYQGRLLSDYVIAGKEAFYKMATGKTELSDADRASLGLWRFNADDDNYSGSIDLYKIFPISYLDRQVFRTAENVEPGEEYIFPMYGNMEFKFSENSISPVTVGVVIDSNGDVRTNMQSASNLATDSINGCQGDILPAGLKDNNGVQQYRLGTLGRAFIDEKTVSMRLVFADPVFGSLNGALVGMNSTIQASTNTDDKIVIGGALLNLSNVLNGTSRVGFTNSAGESVGWANTYASFQKVYNNNNTDETTEETNLAKLSGGSVSFKLADCYSIKTKNKS
ncbi:hypothetical protein [Acinetobacter sp. YH16038]|uniref:putative pilus system protein FilF n=1 Tax=Acinetobacter sp. YH16038 TaxID=2601183 RepID=UPI0015D2192D|nr:hypothetical protein [Acinetobacter sp. YH16038]